jgi:hypothetical protein
MRNTIRNYLFELSITKAYTFAGPMKASLAGLGTGLLGRRDAYSIL